MDFLLFVFLLFASIGTMLIVLGTYSERKEVADGISIYGISLAIAGCVCAAFLCYAINMSETNEENKRLDKIIAEQKHESWVANKCPMVKYECGGKHKYACELEVDVVGRVKVYGEYLQSYPTCGEK